MANQQDTFLVMERDQEESSTSLRQPMLKNLRKGEMVQRRYRQKIRNASKYTFSEFRYKGSVIPAILFPGFITTAWAVLWTCFYFLLGWKWLAVPNQLIGIISSHGFAFGIPYQYRI
jgi:hypothetical protein